MDIRQLRYFVAIVEQGSITRASEKLRIAQPALSLHLKNMEEYLGTRLLIRSRTGVTPTEAGILLENRARAILDDLARTEDDIRTLDADPMGVVRIGLTGTISAIVALPLIAACKNRYPHIELNIAEAMSGFIADWLSEGRVDMAVLYERSQQEGIISELLLEEELVILWGSDDCPSKMSVRGLRDVPMVLPSSAHGLRTEINAALSAYKITPNVAIEIDSYANIKRLVAAGYGASILPSHAVLEDVEAGKLSVSKICNPSLWRGAHLMYRSGRPVTRAQEAICDLLREVILELLDTGDWAAARLPQAVLNTRVDIG